LTKGVIATVAGTESEMSVDSFSIEVVVVHESLVDMEITPVGVILEGIHARTIVVLNKARGTSENFESRVVIRFIVPLLYQLLSDRSGRRRTLARKVGQIGCNKERIFFVLLGMSVL
jgi:hypothetical protein